MATKAIRVGLMVGANTFREPTLTAKLATTLDHISGGRAVLGLGAAWFEEEHMGYGLPFGSSASERLGWLGDALPIIRGMLHSESPSAREGSRYAAHNVRNDPPPIQRPLPILVGGGGPKVTLHLVAKFADIHDLSGTPDAVDQAELVLREWCAKVDRDPSQIERTAGVGPVFIRDSRKEAKRAQADAFARNGGAAPYQRWSPAGSPEDVAEELAPYLDGGRTHLVAGFPFPYDEETMVRLITEVKPLLER
jgi:alkanesulfonate monooxygenase SsuD/methylene tetrahydromethanopterin reductase-like flavin-dependent oxidoreductase (luciferase family)